MVATIGMCYVPPETTLASQSDGRFAQLRFQGLTERLLVATAQGHAVLAGDFNARVGSLPDPWVADVGTGIPPQLQNTNSSINTHGRKLVRLCADSAMILCTGTTLADTPPQPTFKASTNTVASRLDHVLVDPDLFSSIQYRGVGLTRPDTDHMLLEMRILLSAAAPPSPPLPPVRQHTPTWMWSGAKREQYALASGGTVSGQVATELCSCRCWGPAAGRWSLQYCIEDCSSDGRLAPNPPSEQPASPCVKLSLV
ncbi:TPA: hypothetical protein ACH3X1_012331 [Trebouxia sp. C0004]